MGAPSGMDPRVREDDAGLSFPATPSSFPPLIKCHSRLRPGIQGFMDPRVREDDGLPSFLAI
jgi:hypothetical protein